MWVLALGHQRGAVGSRQSGQDGIGADFQNLSDVSKAMSRKRCLESDVSNSAAPQGHGHNEITVNLHAGPIGVAEEGQELPPAVLTAITLLELAGFAILYRVAAATPRTGCFRLHT